MKKDLGKKVTYLKDLLIADQHKWGQTIGISSKDYNIFLTIEENPGCTQLFLAKKRGVERSSLTRFINKYSKMGYIERQAAQAQCARRLLSQGQHDIGAANALELFEQGARAVAEARLGLPLFQGFPEHVGQETHQDVAAHAAFFMMPDRPDAQLAFVNAESRFGLRELGVGLPNLLGGPARDVGAQDVTALGQRGRALPVRTHRPLHPQAGG